MEIGKYLCIQQSSMHGTKTEYGEIIFENILLTWIANDGIFTNKKGEHTHESELIFKTLYVHVLRTYTAINMQG